MDANAASSRKVFAALCRLAGLPEADLAGVRLTGDKPLLPSSFHVGVAAQSTIAAAVYGACQVGVLRGLKMPDIDLNMHAAERECTGYFQLDNQTPASWAPLSGLYPCQDGYVRIHANFDHHRDGACRLLGLSDDPASLNSDDVVRALQAVKAETLETFAAEAGMPIYAMRSFAEWDQLPQAGWLSEEPLFRIKKIGQAAPKILSAQSVSVDKPLANIRVLDLTRILAGPVAGRSLAAYGADVMLVNSPKLPNIAHIADTSRGKRSVHIDLQRADGKLLLQDLVSQGHVFIQGYRPGGLQALGFGPEQLATLCPGIVSVSLSAFGTGSPWAERRGFDSLVQTAAGFNVAEAEAAAEAKPRALPVQILDFASGFLMAFATSVALARQQQEGGSWHVEVSLAQTAHWLRSMGRVTDNLDQRQLEIRPYLVSKASGFGELKFLPHAPLINGAPLGLHHRSERPGADEPRW